MPTYADVKLLLPFDGSDGSTTFTDASAAARTVTANGNAQIDTAQSVYGGASGLFDGSGDYLTIADSADFDFLIAGDFTVEFWVRFASTTAAILFNKASGTGVYPVQILLNGAGKIQARGFNSAGSTLLFDIQQSSTVSTGVWYHVACTRAGSTFTLWVDGASQGTSTSSSNLLDSAQVISIGAYSTGASGVSGWIDDLRLTSGAWYTAGFTPTGPHPTSDGVEGHIAADGPLGAPALLGSQSVGSILTAGPLGEPALLAVHAFGSILAAGPLGSPSLLGVHSFGSILAAGPLGAPRLLGNQSFAVASASGPLGAPALLAWHDFTGAIEETAPLRYVCDLTTPDGTVRVPISSWQATLQTDISCYSQCVIPAVEPYVDAIIAATHFAVYRQLKLIDGSTLEYLMTEAEPDAPAFARGPYRYTCTLSGYSPALVAEDDPSSTLDRTLQNVRQTAQNGSTYRVQCDIDVMLRPGHRAFVGETSFVVRYINYVVNTQGQSMQVGSASNGA